MPITIGIPFYNAERFLPDAIRSAFAQKYKDWELILVDDGSTDRSLEIARSVKDERVRVLSDGRNIRLMNRLNQITAESAYDLVARMDADDIMHPQRLEMQLRCFDNPDVQVVSTAYCTINDSNEIKSVRNIGVAQDVSPAGILGYKHRLCHPSLLVRTRWLRRNPYHTDYKSAEDLELFLRTSINGELTNMKASLVPHPLLFYREDRSQNYSKTAFANVYINRAIRTHCRNLPFYRYFAGKTKWALRNNAYWIMSTLGVLPWFKQLRETKAKTLPNYQELVSALQTVLQTPVPGMDEFLKKMNHLLINT